MLGKFTQSITKQEAFHVLDNLLYEERLTIDEYAKMVDELRSFDGSRELYMEIAVDKPVVLTE